MSCNFYLEETMDYILVVWLKKQFQLHGLVATFVFSLCLGTVSQAQNTRARDLGIPFDVVLVS